MAQSSFQGFIQPKPDKKGGGSNIKSIQRGSVAINALPTVVTIAAVDVTKAIVKVYFACPDTTAGTDGRYVDVGAVLTNATTVSLYYQATVTGNVAYWEVIEFYNVKSLQTGILTMSASSGLADTAVTISAINTAKSFLYMTFILVSAGTTSLYWGIGAQITSSTQIDVFRGSNVPAYTAYWQLIEFY